MAYSKNNPFISCRISVSVAAVLLKNGKWIDTNSWKKRIYNVNTIWLKCPSNCRQMRSLLVCLLFSIRVWCNRCFITSCNSTKWHHRWNDINIDQILFHFSYQYYQLWQFDLINWLRLFYQNCWSSCSFLWFPYWIDWRTFCTKYYHLPRNIIYQYYQLWQFDLINWLRHFYQNCWSSCPFLWFPCWIDWRTFCTQFANALHSNSEG